MILNEQWIKENKSAQSPRINEYYNTTYQDLLDTEKALLRRVYIN